MRPASNHRKKPDFITLQSACARSPFQSNFAGIHREMVTDGNALIKFEPALSLLTTFFVHPSPHRQNW
jgi:hypothetical protein